MTGYAVSLGMGRYSSEKSALFIPRKVDPNKRAIIYAHGAGGSGTQPLDFKYQSGLVNIFGLAAQQGFVVLSGDWGGPQTYGNDAEMAAMDAGWQWLRTSGLCAADKVILTGGSMGTLSVHRWAADNETKVAGINCWIPAIDLDALRNTNALGLRNLINAAWELPVNSYPAAGGPEVPYRGQVIARANELNDIPTHMWYTSGDTATLAEDVLQYVAARANAVAHEVSTTLDHSDEAIIASDTDFILNFFESVGYGSGAVGNNVLTLNMEETF